MDFSKEFDSEAFYSAGKDRGTGPSGACLHWIVDFFERHAHRTVFNGEESSTASISASIIQGSGIGPAAYAVISADLRPIHSGNSMVKFADDMYIVIPSADVDTRTQEIDNVAFWAGENNLKLNVSTRKFS